MTIGSQTTSVRCRCCGFSFQHPAFEQPTPVFCPSCGDEFVCVGFRTSTPAEKSKQDGDVAAVSQPAGEKSGKTSKRIGVRGTRILLLTVCLQWVVLLAAPFAIFHRSENVPAPAFLSHEKEEPVHPKPESPPLLATLKSPAAVPAPVQPTVAKEFIAPPSDAERLAEEKKREEETKRLAEEKKREEETKRLAEEKKREEETKRLAEEKKKAEETSPRPKTSADLLPTGISAKDKEASPTSYEIRLAKARSELESARALIVLDAERALAQALETVGLFKELGQAVPSMTYWIVAQAIASQRWGETLIEDSAPVENMAASSDSRWLLTQCNDNTIWIWDILRSQKSMEGFKLDSGEKRVVKLLFTPDFRLAICGDEDGKIRIWNTTLKNPADSIVTLKESVYGLRDLQVSPDGRWLVACGGPLDNSPLSARSPSAGREIVSIQTVFPTAFAQQTGENVVRSMAVYSTGNRLRPYKALLNGEEPASSRLDLEKRFLPLRPAQSHLPDFSSRNRAGRIIPVTYRNGGPEGVPATKTLKEDPNVVWLWDLHLLENGVIPQPILLRGHEKPIHVMQISDDSRWLVTGSDDTTARVYDLKATYPGADQAVLKGHQLGITTIAIASNSRWVATGSRDNTIRLWTLPDAGTSPMSSILNGHLGWISSLVVDETRDRLISGSYDKTIRIWSIPRGRIDIAADRAPLLIENDQGVVRQLLLTRDGKMLVSLGADASLRLRELDNDVDSRQSVMIRNRTLPITKMCLTPDDRWLVFNFVNQRDPRKSGVRLWPIRFEDLVESAASLQDTPETAFVSEGTRSTELKINVE